jgi:hypothetical protein
VSVINKMLRDLDNRKAAQMPLSADTLAGAQAPLRQGAASIHRVGGSVAGSPSRHWLWMGVAGLVAAAGAAAWFWMQAGQGALHVETARAPVPAMPAPAAVPVAPPAPAAEPASAPSVTASQAVVNPEPSNAAPGTMVLRMEQSLSARRALDALLSTPVPSAPIAAAVPTVSTTIAPTAPRERNRAPVEPAAPVAARQAIPTVGKAPVTPGAPAQGDTTPVTQRQQQAGGDALAQAQNLWNTGSRDAAIDLMQQSIAAAERAVKAGSGASAGSVLIPLVREIARMQLAEGRFGAVWEMLTRLEPHLGNQPDLWAIRANAAQRLGRHQDSVHAYMVALQSRPDEQRWLLGTAVSLAALGQISSASEMAEKARTIGPVSKEILAYLRQSGVTIRD